MARPVTTLGYVALAAWLLLAAHGVAAQEGEASPTPGAPSAPQPDVAPEPPPAVARSSAPERPPAVLHVTVGLMGGSADFGLSFDAGLEVHRWFVMYSSWIAFYDEGSVTFSGAKAGYVHPIHRVWGLYGAAGGGRLSYRAYPDLAPEFTANGGAITVEMGIMLGPLFRMNGLTFGLMAVIPTFTPGMPPGREVEAPALMASMTINPVLLALGILTGH